ncbi:Mkc1 MAP kinase [Perkinsela sp. CCAP 1560/4]|nr:Mkc1 MAP kinase [Perkinsela sp. CCAP 1560/4]|eukprot:KNH07163.1 Mkc1 MAP kinase [Perkinsela sp. CCAP 1560/4]
MDTHINTTDNCAAAYSSETDGMLGKKAMQTPCDSSVSKSFDIIEVSYKHGKYILALPSLSYYGVEHIAKDGAFGILFQAVTIRNIPVMIKKQSLETSVDCEASLRELSVLYYFHAQGRAHSNVIRLLDAWEYNDCLYLVVPLFDLSLEEYLEKLYPIDASQRLSIFQKILQGVHHLHENEILHRDLKPENIVLSHHGDDLAIIDFGASRVGMDKKQQTKGKYVSTYPYRPPEAESGIYLKASDVWSLGCIFAQIISGRYLFERDESMLHFDHLQIGKRLALLKPMATPFEFFLLSIMLKLDPEERASTSDLLEATDTFRSRDSDRCGTQSAYTEPRYVFEELQSMRDCISHIVRSIRW